MASAHAGGRLLGKSSVITGAAHGIGRATAEWFAREHARLVIGDVDAEALDKLHAELSAAGAEVTSVAGDVSVSGDVERLIRTAVERYGRLDVVVANAGVIPLLEITEATEEDWEHVMAVDGKGMFLTCKYAVQAMLETGGSIVCLSSISGIAGQRGQSTYGPAKFVASGLAKHLAVEHAGHGIRVNAVAPGTIRTDRVRRLETEPGGPEYLRGIKKLHPLARLGEPAEVAAAIGFLASDEASFITGAVLPVDGGYLAQ
ncbi:SDR family NAD(P)-dependent oxidoreductase [Streptomyces malaysiensis]|uniref:SDR family oxidoreductase n=1 Tax=Streptomyces malaysiensis subsp. samsunensis TaxID=459658 RepID=A0A9X2S1I8_STRMQ|nr:SDR family NAD(P)-dependent oxidoreductase [Streptomyces samsunensis]MCQ8836249.1 SDR family oxidoreductase [Streptomyces samsunensis]